LNEAGSVQLEIINFLYKNLRKAGCWAKLKTAYANYTNEKSYQYFFNISFDTWLWTEFYFEK
jgi:hypothetical protein